MNFDKDYIFELLKKSYMPFMITMVLGVQIFYGFVVSYKLEKLENTNFNLEQKIGTLQTILGLDNGPITNVTPVNIGKGLLNPAEPQKVMLPMKPDNVIDYVYLEKGTKEQDNTYPVGKKIIYAVQDDIFDVGSLYSKKLLKMGRQVSSIKEGKSTKGEKTAILSFDATNGMNSITVEFFNKIENYNKKVGSFVKLVINN